MTAADQTTPVVPVADTPTTRRWARELVAERRGQAAIVVLLLLVATLGFAAVPAIVGRTVDIAIEGGPQSRLSGPLLALASIVVTAVVAGVFGRYQAAKFGESILDELRTRVFDAAVALPGSVVEEVGTGALVSRTTEDVEALAAATRQSIPAMLFSTVLSAGIVVALLITDVALGAAALVAAAFAATPGVRWYLRNAPDRYMVERQADAGRSGALLDHYTGRQTMWAFGATEVSRGAIRSRGRAMKSAQLSTTAARNRLRPSLRLAQAAALAVVVGWGSVRLGDDVLTPGALTAAALYTLRLMDPLTTLLEEVDELQQARAALSRIAGLVDHSRELEVSGGWTGPDGSMVGFPVEIDALRFGYEADQPIFDGLDVTIAAGQHVMVVGPSGAGKTTLGGLITGSHTPQAGSVRIAGVDVGAVQREELRAYVAQVAQETHVFARSIRDNVALGRDDAPADAIHDALVAVGADRWIAELEDGVDSEVSHEHPDITPPRAQQLNLARMLCLAPPVVVLDEATADLDPSGARQTAQRLRQALAGRTLITIAHRLDAAPAMDRIVMIDGGVVVADGHHDDLLETSTHYAKLWEAWRRPRREVTDR